MGATPTGISCNVSWQHNVSTRLAQQAAPCRSHDAPSVHLASEPIRWYIFYSCRVLQGVYAASLSASQRSRINEIRLFNSGSSSSSTKNTSSVGHHEPESSSTYGCRSTAAHIVYTRRLQRTRPRRGSKFRFGWYYDEGDPGDDRIITSRNGRNWSVPGSRF